MRIDIGGCRLFFDVEGAKLRPDGDAMREVPTLLLLHGGPGWDHSAFKPAFSCLADIAQVIYLDHRGNGRSDRGQPDQWALARWADDVVHFCEALEIEAPIVLGSSFGGTVAIAYATRHPDHPSGLILSNTTARRRPDLILAAFERLGGVEAREVARRYIEAPDAKAEADYLRVCLPHYGRLRSEQGGMPLDRQRRAVRNPEVIYHYYNDRLRSDGSIEPGEVKRFDFLASLSSIRCPSLVMAGTADPITPVEGAREIAAGISSELLQYVEFEGCGHPLIEDDPDLYFGSIRRFVADLARGRAVSANPEGSCD